MHLRTYGNKNYFNDFVLYSLFFFYTLLIFWTQRYMLQITMMCEGATLLMMFMNVMFPQGGSLTYLCYHVIIYPLCLSFWDQYFNLTSSILYFRQIRDTVNWIFCEQMLVCYISVFRDTFWPNGKLAPHVKVRSDSERSETKDRAQQKLLDNIPGNCSCKHVLLIEGCQTWDLRTKSGQPLQVSTRRQS